MTTTASTAEASEDVDAVLATLANERRRVILRSLTESAGNERSVEPLIDDVADGVSTEKSPDEELHRRIYTELYHSHLPALEESGLLVHDREDDVVRCVADDSTLELLDLIEQYESNR